MAISDLLVTEFDQEVNKTRAMLERVPDGKAEFAPHPKSMTLGRLAPHVAELAGFGLTVLTTSGMDFSSGEYKPLPFESAAQLVRAFDDGVAKVRDVFGKAPGLRVDRELGSLVPRTAAFQRAALRRVSSDVPQPHHSSSCAARRIPAHEWHTAAADVWTISGRDARILRFGRTE